MPHSTTLITTIVVALVLAFGLGALAHRFRVSPLVGYLLAGVLIGPFTPGYVADQSLATELAELGIILLMFGVGLHFSLKELLSVKTIAVPGALVQIGFSTLLGFGLGRLLGWPVPACLVFGLALSVASTVVLLRALQDRHMINTREGHIAVGWLIVEDLAMVLALVLLPGLGELLKGGGEGGAAAGNGHELLLALGLTLGKVVAFIAFMLIVGRRVIPWILHYVAHTGSRELFRLAVLSIALGVAYGAAKLFDVSFALGAFFAGMILSESELSQQAAEESLPLRDAFAVLFFVSAGMLFNPAILLHEPLPVLATLAILLIGKSVAALVIVLAFRHPLGTALVISASLAQIGEFSFILSGLGTDLGMLPEQGHDLVVAGAILSILVNPLLFLGVDRLKARTARRRLVGEGTAAEPPAPTPLPVSTLRGHVVIVGYGRVGGLVGGALEKAGRPFLVIEDRQDAALALRQRGIETIIGNAAAPEVLQAANLPEAAALLVAIPNGFEAGQVTEQARAANAALDIVARAHSDAEVDHLQRHGADLVIMGEREIARGMIERVLGSVETAPATAAASS